MIPVSNDCRAVERLGPSGESADCKDLRRRRHGWEHCRRCTSLVLDHPEGAVVRGEAFARSRVERNLCAFYVRAEHISYCDVGGLRACPGFLRYYVCELFVAMARCEKMETDPLVLIYAYIRCRGISPARA